METEILNLLQSRNRWLEQLLDQGTDFLANAEKGDFALLDDFLAFREKAIRALGMYDRKITDTLSGPIDAAVRKDLATKVKPHMEKRDAFIAAIIQADDKILSRIESEKDRIAAEINANRRAEKNVKKYKSEWITESGEELDKTL